MSMTPRERVLAAIDRKEPDRVPVDLGATPSSGISAIAYGNLKTHLAIASGATRIYDVVQQLAEPEEALLDRFAIDAVDLGRAFNTRSGDWYEIALPDGQRALYPRWFRPERDDDGGWTARSADGMPIARMPAKSAFFDQTHFPYIDGYPSDYERLPEAMGKVMWQAFAHSPWDHAGEERFWDTLRAEAIALRAATDRAIMVVCGCNLFEWGTFLRRLDNFLVDIITEPKEVERLLDALMKLHLATLEKVCRAVGDVVDILRFGDDLGMDSNPFMRPESYRALFKPRHGALCGYVHANSKMRTFLHSCGSIHALLPDLIEAGYDVINPVQTTCRDMEPEKLKKEFGREIAFWGGGCDTRNLLGRATPDAVKDHVLERLKIFAPGGGFVFNTEHNILPEVPPENIVAMFEAIDLFNGGS